MAPLGPTLEMEGKLRPTKSFCWLNETHTHTLRHTVNTLSILKRVIADFQGRRIGGFACCCSSLDSPAGGDRTPVAAQLWSPETLVLRSLHVQMFGGDQGISIIEGDILHIISVCV